MKEMLLSTMFYSQGNEGLERVSKLPKAADFSAGETGLLPTLRDSRVLPLSPPAFDTRVNDLEMDLPANQQPGYFT